MANLPFRILEIHNNHDLPMLLLLAISRLLRLVLLPVLLVLIFPLIHQGQPRYVRLYIMVDGKKMSYESFGLSTRHAGDPVLVFEGGFGASGAVDFNGLFPALSKFSAGIGYDRNGEGESDEDSTIVTDGDLIRRLHAFLQTVHVAPPYILVSHSMGGAYIRLFTSLYPTEVIGLVFIDPTDFMETEQQDEQIKLMSRSGQGARAWVVPFQDSLASDTLLSLRTRHRAKRLAALFRIGFFQEYSSLEPLPNIPVSVLLAIDKPRDNSAYTSGELARFKAEDHFRIENYISMIEKNSKSCVIVLPGYRHSIHHQDPALVVSVIARVYQNALLKLKGRKQS